MIKSIFSNTFVFFILFSNVLLAQDDKKCATDEVMYQFYKSHPEVLQTYLDNENFYNTLSKSAKTAVLDTEVRIIPVVFHVLHENGPENISDAQIIDAIAILNRDFRKRNADTIDVIPTFKHLVSDIRVEFRLAQLDPQGNCTNGIDRIYSSKTNYGNDSAKLNKWPRDKYLNIWTVKTLEHTDWAAYAYYPSAATGSLAVRDGILTSHKYVGSIGTSSPNTSRTMTHEVGHWLDLGHPWNRTINISINVGLACGDDLIDDTPITKGHTTCPNLLTPDCSIESFSAAKFNFDSTKITSGTIDPTPIDTVFKRLDISAFSANGISSNSLSDSSFAFSGWDTGALNGETNFSVMTGTINTSKYYEVTLAPKLPYSMSLTGLSFSVKRSPNGPRTYAVRSSVDGFFTNLTASVSPTSTNLSVNGTNVFFYNNDTTLIEAGSTVKVSGSTYINNNIPITFRIYAWNSEDIAGTFDIDNVSILGTAGTIENIQNYMEYSFCDNMFTTGQKDRMRLAINSSIADRSNLWSQQNLIATGVLNPAPCAPRPDFYTAKTRICAGNTIIFTKNILNGTETSRLWTFEGGIPATSTAVNPSVTYTMPGIYSVTLTTTNAVGTGTVVKTQYIRVDSALANIDYNGSYTEAFENNAILDYMWQSYDYDNNGHKWFLANNAGINGSNAVGINSFESYFPDVDELMSPSFDLTGNSLPILSFKLASASTSSVLADTKDELKVFNSVNCGVTWLLRATYNGSALINNGTQTSYFIPNSSSIWDTKTIQIPAFFQTSNFRVKFQYKSSNTSNNLYIDDINISNSTGLNNNSIKENNFVLFPNPSNDKAFVKYHLNSSSDTKIEILDILGKKMFDVSHVNQAMGDYIISISKQEQKLTNGIYFLRVSIGDITHTQKLIITE